MNDTTNLVSDLLRKLTELDSKVNEYRQDMAQEFRRYSQQRLRDVPGDVSAKVERLVSEQFHNYPALSPELNTAFDSLSQFGANSTSADEKVWSIAQSSPPASPQNPEIPVDDGTRSPHEREREFHGLFTPSYLPLLDAVQRRSFTPPTLSPQIPEIQAPNNSQEPSPTPLVNDIPSRPDPVRRGTEDTLSSVTSDDSTARSRRSALRRSSSSSTTKTQSPRRVRFEVEGEEVLPTSSPPMSPRVPDYPTSPLGNPTSFLDDSYNAIVIQEDSSLLGSSPPMPKKITSTDRLKAMARSSTEDTSKWEVVGNLEAADDEEEELVMAGFNARKANDTSPDATNHINSGTTAHCINDARLPTQLGARLTTTKQQVEEENETAEEADDADDVLMMPPLSSFKGKKRFSPPLETASQSESKGTDPQTAARKIEKQAESTNTINENHHDEEDMFDFEDNEDIASGDAGNESGSAKKYIDEDDAEEDEEADATPIAENPVLFSTSPAIPMAKPVAAKPASPTLASPSPRQVAASVGSFRGKPFSIDIIRDPELHKKAAEMGDFYTFVGSVDGRSGVDESSSYRPELTYYSGTPRSLSERLMREDLDETRRNTEKNERS
ncbi:hypothetical protein F4821DRAFT_253812 [Hypoxylon rubiginosum]|uniref:Uncharacterized protein n=1 Tax=Hypoxylon rubiginosum TaxID=110542 RepID=A0ACC0DIY1_9PEZI|nr:hypothetical protein F4821DRAFT_253812 [Hypoxylon rubiginosum]